MEWEGWFSLALIGTVLLTLVFTSLSTHIVMLVALALLSISGVLTPDEAFTGFANPGLMTIAALYIVAAGLNASGGIDLLVKKTLGQPTQLRTALLRIFGPVTLLSSLLNNTPVVATMIPAIHAWSRLINMPASKLMIPLSYGAILGGTLTLIGSSTHLIISSEYEKLTGNPGFSLFFVTSIGLPVTVVGILFMLAWFPRALPNRSKEKMFGDLREFTLEICVTPEGPLVGKNITEAGLRQLPRVYLVEIVRDDAIVTAVSSEERLKGGDRLVFTGDTQAITELLKINGLSTPPDLVDANTHTSSVLEVEHAERRLVEAVVSPHCTSIGQRIRDSRFRNRYGAVVLAVARNGERIKGNLGTIVLNAGDTLLLEARPAFVSRQRYTKDFLLINDLKTEPLRHQKAYLAWAIMLGLVIIAASGMVTMLNAAMLAAFLMLATKCCSVSVAERSLDFRVLVTIGASFALGVALQKTGVADLLAESLLRLSSGETWIILLLVYFSVSLLTEVITNNGAAIIMLPIVLQITEKANIAHEPFVLAVMIAASASFATPLGYQTNLMVYGPGGYRFNDFLKVGIPMNCLIGFVTITFLLLFWI